MRAAAALPALALALGVVEGVVLSTNSETQATFELKAWQAESRRGLEEGVREAFRAHDSDGDGEVSAEELRRALRPGRGAEEASLRRMMAECDIDASGSCSKQELEAWLRRSGHELYHHHEDLPLHVYPKETQASILQIQQSEHESEPCGLEGVQCFRQVPNCAKASGLMGWLTKAACPKHPCVCEPLDEAKFLANLGARGTLAAASALNISSLVEEDMPQCGSGWSGRSIVVAMDVARLPTMQPRIMATAAAAQFKRPDAWHYVNQIVNAKTAYAKAVLYKTRHHQVTPGGKAQPICMLSFLGTDSYALWKLKFSKNAWGKQFNAMKDEVRRAVDEECCTPEFTASKFVVTGHSLGGVMSMIFSGEMVSNWTCNGRDLTVEDVTNVAIAPGGGLTKALADQQLSCDDPASCLAGRVVMIYGENDGATSYPGSIHPAVETYVPCNVTERYDTYRQSIPTEDGVFMGSHDPLLWCHGLYNTVPKVEDVLVGERGWGSSCSGQCGDPNGQLQRQQQRFTRLYGEPESYHPTSCEGKGDPETGHCACEWVPCDTMTSFGHCVA